MTKLTITLCLQSINALATNPAELHDQIESLSHILQECDAYHVAYGGHHLRRLKKKAANLLEPRQKQVRKHVLTRI